MSQMYLLNSSSLQLQHRVDNISQEKGLSHFSFCAQSLSLFLTLGLTFSLSGIIRIPVNKFFLARIYISQDILFLNLY